MKVNVFCVSEWLSLRRYSEARCQQILQILELLVMVGSQAQGRYYLTKMFSRHQQALELQGKLLRFKTLRCIFGQQNRTEYRIFTRVDRFQHPIDLSQNRKLSSRQFFIGYRLDQAALPERILSFCNESGGGLQPACLLLV